MLSFVTTRHLCSASQRRERGGAASGKWFCLNKAGGEGGEEIMFSRRLHTIEVTGGEGGGGCGDAETPRRELE